MERYDNQSKCFIVPPVYLFEHAFGQDKSLILIGTGVKIDLKNGVLGSSASEADMLIKSSFLSRRHCLVRKEDIAWWIEDLKSTNGTWINGQRLIPGEAVMIRENDQLQMADLTFLVKGKK